MKKYVKKSSVGVVVFLLIMSVIAAVLFVPTMVHPVSAHAQGTSGDPSHDCDAAPGQKMGPITVWPCQAVALAGSCLNERQGPGPDFMNTPIINCDPLNQQNNAFLITCQTPGTNVWGSGVWDKIVLSPDKNSGNTTLQYAYASDYYMATTGFNQFSQDQGLNIPKC